MLDAFNRHPTAIGESYAQHLAQAAAFGVTMIIAGLACLIHAIFPFWFEKTASDCIKRLHAKMSARLRVEASAAQASSTVQA